MVFLARFPMPAVVLSALLTVGHLVLRISDDLRPPLFLQPASTIIRPQQVVTAGLFEDSAPNLLVVVLALLYSAKALQPAWGDRECVRFVMLINVLHLCASWVCMVVLYVLFREEHYLFARLGGCAGLLGALSVAIKQQVAHGALPTDAHPAWLAAALPHVVVLQLCASLAVLALLRAGPPDEFLLALNGTVVAWVYLRFYQPRPGGAAGDSSSSFAFAALFPGPVQPPLRILGRVCFGVASSVSCGCFPPLGWDAPVPTHPAVSWMGGVGAGVPMTGASLVSAAAAPPPLPTVTTDDPEVAERRRARARALLEERLQKAQCAAGPAAAAAAPVQ